MNKLEFFVTPGYVRPHGNLPRPGLSMAIAT
jgi:hypothetical protein